nr:MAG TPA: hypothetical protein [Caudoviricetes sp.]
MDSTIRQVLNDVLVVLHTFNYVDWRHGYELLEYRLRYRNYMDGGRPLLPSYRFLYKSNNQERVTQV